MTEKIRKPRSDSKMYQLSKDVLEQVNYMLLNENMKYSDIQRWLETEHGMKISISSISNYAVKVYRASQRVADDLERTKLLANYIGNKSDRNASKATVIQITVNISECDCRTIRRWIMEAEDRITDCMKKQESHGDLDAEEGRRFCEWRLLRDLLQNILRHYYAYDPADSEQILDGLDKQEET